MPSPRRVYEVTGTENAPIYTLRSEQNQTSKSPLRRRIHLRDHHMAQPLPNGRHVAVDNHPHCVSYAEALPNERSATANAFLSGRWPTSKSQGIAAQRILTDNEGC